MVIRRRLEMKAAWDKTRSSGMEGQHRQPVLGCSWSRHRFWIALFYLIWFFRGLNCFELSLLARMTVNNVCTWRGALPAGLDPAAPCILALALEREC